VSITESKLVALPVEVLPLDKGISSSGIPTAQVWICVRD